MTTEQRSLLTDDMLAAELAAARREVDRLLRDLREFTVLAHTKPWIALDDLLGDLRAAAITVATLEGLVSLRL